MILSLTGRGISVSFVRITFLIAKPILPYFSFGFATPEDRVFQVIETTDSENLVSHRAAMSMLYLASSIATSAVRLSGRLAPSRSRRVLTFHCPIVSSFLLCLLLPS